MKNYGFVVFFPFIHHEPLHILQLSSGEPHSQLYQVADEKGQGGKQTLEQTNYGRWRYLKSNYAVTEILDVYKLHKGTKDHAESGGKQAESLREIHLFKNKVTCEFVDKPTWLSSPQMHRVAVENQVS